MSLAQRLVIAACFTYAKGHHHAYLSGANVWLVKKIKNEIHPSTVNTISYVRGLIS
jgi:hypothetical protein